MLQRKKLIPRASGRVLEVGVGSGLNLSFYSAENVKQLTAIDPSLETWSKNRLDPSQLGFDFEYVQAFAENIPEESNVFDTVVITYALCTIPDTHRALHEIRRVLKPSGKLLFCEHGMAPDKSVRRWQHVVNPVWKRLGGGCHLNRNIPELIKESGFELSDMETMYLPGWKPASFNYWGSAKPK